ncbi:MAG: cellulase family glycosylhydrolase, partial [Candidatus Eremiobacteraeota bacterium]|nr:cellulase family glycosylhydrolase [Candidatus Eremiobacteraeota bacterium]
FDPARNGFGRDDARFLAAHGFTAVRFGVLLQGVEPAPGRYDDRYVASIRRTVDLLGRYGIRSLLDFHQDLYSQRYQGEGLPAWMALDDGLPAQPQAGFPGDYFGMPALWRAFDNLWTDAKGPGGVGLRERYAAALGHVAAAFRGDPAILGYDVFNEPFPGSPYLSCFPPRGCPEQDAARLAPFTRATIKAIHRNDPKHLAFYEPWLTFDYGAPTGLGRFADSRSGLSFHDYCLATVGAPETPPTRTMCNKLVEERVIANALDQTRVSHDALLLTEFGATTDTTELHEILGLADSNDIPWMDWAYCACGDPTSNGQAEALVYDPRKPPSGSNVNQTALDVLDEPYPRLVAGTPGPFGYDAGSRTFRFRYSTAGVAGSLRPGLPTSVWIGRMHYPHGYHVRVTGAKVVSRAGASVLTLVAKPGARTVSVTVTPA